MNTDEEQGIYEVEDSTENAVAMIGKGYKPRPVVQFERPSNQVVETESGYEVVKSLGWVKFSADFRLNMLKELKGSRLSVFICVSLHLNESGESFPGIDLIAKETGYDRDTVMIAIKEMEGISGLLSVLRKQGKPNRYRPYFVARGVKNEPVQKIRPVGQPVQKSKTSLIKTSPDFLDYKENLRVKENPTTKPNIFELYESNIGVLTPIISNTLKDAEIEYVESWIVDVVGLAVTHNKRNWAYCAAILKRWKEEGKDDGKKLEYKKGKSNAANKQNNPANEAEHTPADIELARQIRAERQAANV